MSVFKSLGQRLASVRKALSKPLRRLLPAGINESDSPRNSQDGVTSNSVHKPPPLAAAAVEDSTDRRDNPILKSHDQSRTSVATSQPNLTTRPPDHSEDPAPGSRRAETWAADHDQSDAQLIDTTPSQGNQDSMTFASFPSGRNDPDEYDGMVRPRLGWSKENQPPSEKIVSVDDAVPLLQKLNLNDGLGQKTNIVPGKEEPDECYEGLQETPWVEEDPAVVAEKAKHLYFIGEALEMVRHPLSYPCLHIFSAQRLKLT